MAIKLFKTLLTLTFQPHIQFVTVFPMHAVVGHVVPVGTQPYPAAPNIGQLPATAAVNVMPRKVCRESSYIAFSLVLHDAFRHLPHSSFSASSCCGVNVSMPRSLQSCTMLSIRRDICFVSKVDEP